MNSSFVPHRLAMPSPHEITTNVAKPLLASGCAVLLCLLAQQIFTSCRARSSFHRACEYLSTFPLSPFGTRAHPHIRGASSNRIFPQLNLHNTRVRRKLGGHLQTALPDARRTPRLRSLLTKNAHPVKH